jgi:hypothetical protein
VTVRPRQHLVLVPTFALLLGLVAQGHAASPWTEYRNQELGFQMLVPSDVKPVTQVGTGGWGSITFKAGKATTVSAVARMGPAQPIDRIREYAVGVSGIPGDRWTRAGDPARDPGAGFEWVESWTASDGKVLVVAVLGHGPRGNYVIFITTTVDEYKKAQAQFVRWAGSIKVF